MSFTFKKVYVGVCLHTSSAVLSEIGEGEIYYFLHHLQLIFEKLFLGRFRNNSGTFAVEKVFF